MRSGVSPNALVRPSLPAITAVPMTRFRNTRLRARNKRSAITATKPKACRLRSHVRDLPDSLVQQNKICVSGSPRVAQVATKSCVLNFRMYQHRQNAGEAAIVRPCAGACPASPVPDWPFSARPWSACPAGAGPQIPSGKGRSSSARGWTRRTACSAGTPLAHRAFAQPRKRSSMRSPPITSVRPGICPSSARHWRR